MKIRVSRYIATAAPPVRRVAASPDVTDVEREQLEAPILGHTDRQRFLSRLGQNPTYASRRLSTGRIALTRLMAAGSEAGQLYSVTVLVSAADWSGPLQADGWPLLKIGGLWQVATGTVPSVNVRVDSLEHPIADADQRARVLAMIARIERSWEDRAERIVVREDELPTTEVRMTAMLLPRAVRERFDYAVRSLNPDCPVRLNCLYKALTTGGARAARPRDRSDDSVPAPYTDALSYFWKPEGPPPWAFAANREEFGGTEATTPAPPRPPAAARTAPAETGGSRRRGVLTAALAVLMVGVGVGGWVIYRHSARRAAVVARLTEIDRRAEALMRDHPGGTRLPCDDRARRELVAEAATLLAESEKLLPAVGTDSAGSKAESLRTWLADARTAATDSARIAATLSNFEQFIQREGELTAASAYPSEHAIATLDAWAGQLEEADAIARKLDDCHAEAAAAALELVRARPKVLPAIVASCEAELQRLRAFFDRVPTTRLDNDTTPLVPAEQERLDAITDRMGQVPASVRTARLPSLRGELESLQKLAGERAKAVGGLRQRFDADYSRAKRLADQYALHLHPTAVAGLKPKWDGAVEALQHARAAHEIWKDHEACGKLNDMIFRWRGSAARLVFSRFEELVEQAQRAYAVEAGGKGPAPNGTAAKRIAEALALYDDFREAIRQYDRFGALHDMAADLSARIHGRKREAENEEEESPRAAAQNLVLD